MPSNMDSIVGWPIVRMEVEAGSSISVMRIRYTDRYRTDLGYGRCNAECCVNRGSGDITIHLSALKDEDRYKLADDLVRGGAILESRLIQGAYNALGVIANAEKIIEYLESYDPQALRQVRDAMKALEIE